MGITSIMCDDCGRATSDFSEDYDRIVRCRMCDLKARSLHARTAYNDKKRWLEATHLAELAELKDQYEKLEAEIKAFSEFGRAVSDPTSVSGERAP